MKVHFVDHFLSEPDLKSGASAGTQIGLLIQALKYFGQKNIDEVVLSRVKKVMKIVRDF